MNIRHYLKPKTMAIASLVVGTSLIVSSYILDNDLRYEEVVTQNIK